MIEFLTQEMSIPAYGFVVLWLIVSFGAWVSGRISSLGEYEAGFDAGLRAAHEVQEQLKRMVVTYDQNQESEND